eukprot:g1462.t1
MTPPQGQFQHFQTDRYKIEKMDSEDHGFLVEDVQTIVYKSSTEIRKWKILCFMFALLSLILVIVLARRRTPETIVKEYFNTPLDNNPNALTFPSDFPTFTVTSTSRASRGTRLVAPYTFAYASNYMAAVNVEGSVTQYVGSAYSFAEVDELDNDNGTLIADSRIYLTDALLNEIRSVKCNPSVPGYPPIDTTSNYDFDFLPNGDVILICLDAELRDLTAYGGPPNAGVIITSNVWELNKATSVVLRDDNTILAAMTYLNQIVLINASTNDKSKQIIWSIGGKGTEADVRIDDSDPRGGFTGVENAQLLSDGTLLLYDNGVINFNTPDHPSRICRYRFNADTGAGRTMSLLWSYEDTISSIFGGGVQLLPSGNYIMTRLSQPCVVEITEDKEVVWSLEVYDNKMPDQEVLMVVTRTYFVPFPHYPRVL